MKKDIVIQTKSGIFLRLDDAIGLLAYSPYTGLIYACVKNYANALFSWANKEVEQIDRQDFINTIGPGWYCDITEGVFTSPHLLPCSEDWPIVPSPTRPIVINWLITGTCPLSCTYCYASDIMSENKKEPSEIVIEETARNILFLKPLAVVLTGGDPLCSPHLYKVIKLLHSKVGIIIDTSGHLLRQKHIEFFKEYNIAVRVSIDAEQPKYHEKYRPFLMSMKPPNHSSSLDAAISAICQCIDANVPVTVQTVATKYNANDLPAMGDKLYRLGVRTWRIFKIARSNCNTVGYKELVGDLRQQRKLYPYIFKKLSDLSKNSWKYKMSLQLISDHALNAVFLVSPEGFFYTESNVPNKKKVIIDEESPRRPKISSLSTIVNMQAHLERYLNLTTENAIRG